MHPRLQRRIQRYGWDLAARHYERCWRAHLEEPQSMLFALAPAPPDSHVLDIACGTGLIACQAARAVGPGGSVLGIDLSARMIERARHNAARHGLANARFERMEAEALACADAGFDLAYCGFGLMYMPDPGGALSELRRVLRPGGRVGLTVWGEGKRCGWSTVLPIIDAEVSGEVCPLFFRLGWQGELARLCAAAGFTDIRQRRVSLVLDFADAEEACDAVLVGGPVALAWSRFDETARARVRARYLDAIMPWRRAAGYRIPTEYLAVTAVVPDAAVGAGS
jgi:SAM-dependent methyltransferase